MVIDIQEMKNQVERFQSLLRHEVENHEILAWELVWKYQEAMRNGLRFIWFKEEGDTTHNGLSLVDKQGSVVEDIITGYNTENAKRLQEAMLAYEYLKG